MSAAEEHLVTLVKLRNEAYDARVRVQQKILGLPDIGDDELRRCLEESKALGEEIIHLDECIARVQAQIDGV